MRNRFTLFRRHGVFYSQDSETKKQISLKTANRGFGVYAGRGGRARLLEVDDWMRCRATQPEGALRARLSSLRNESDCAVPGRLTLLAQIGSVMIADYFVWRRKK